MTARGEMFEATRNNDESYQRLTRPRGTAMYLIDSTLTSTLLNTFSLREKPLQKYIKQIVTLRPPKAVMKTLVPRTGSPLHGDRG